MDVTSVRWRKSSRSGNGGNTCVELAALGGRTGVRDSKDPQGGRLAFGPAVFAAFLRDVKTGRHDL